MENTIPIEEVPEDIDSMATGTIMNPLKEDFVHAFKGKEVTLLAESESKPMPLPMAAHLAKHLAIKIVRDRHRAGIAKIRDDKKRDEESRKAIPNYKGQIFEEIKNILKPIENDLLERPDAMEILTR